MSESTLTYGLNAGGFVRMRLPEIRRAIFDDFTARTSLSLDETPDSFTGQLIATFAEREARLWELLEASYLAVFPVTATGNSLNLAVSFSGVRQLQPSRSRALAYFTGDPGTEILEGSAVRGTLTTEGNDGPPRFRTENLIRISKQSVVAAVLVFPNTIVANSTYSVSIDGQQFSVVALNGQTPAQIALRIKNLIGTTATAVNEKLFINNQISFSIDWTSNIGVENLTSQGYLLAETFGKIPADENTLTVIETATTGWKSVNNPFDAILGTLIESEEDLRARYALGVYRLGAGTLPSIYANIVQDIPGVVSTRVFENATDEIDADGRPPHTLELVIEGGDTQLIFDRLHALKPAGITAFGNTPGRVLASDGFYYPLAISRPEERWIWLRISLSTTNEEAVPGDLTARVIAALVAEGNTLLPGQDVLLQRIGAAAFKAASGISRIVVAAAITAPNAAAPSIYNDADISIGPRQKARFNNTRVIFG